MKGFGAEDLKRELHTNVPVTEGKKIIIWGTGNTAQLYQEGMERLGTEGFQVIAYCDNNLDKWGGGKEFNGRPVISPEELVGQEDVCVLICTPTPASIREISLQLDAFKIPYYLLDEVILKQHATEVMECYNMLEDPESKNVYADIILSHCEGRNPLPENCMYEGAYFAIDRFKAVNQSEVFIDCGAYVGDSVERYIWSRDGIFQKIIAFEPDPNNYTAMEKRVRRLGEEWNLRNDAIVLLPYGVADMSMTASFESYDSGLGSKFVKVSETAESGRIVSLDEAVPDAYSFLKADIESYEYRMLLGAEKGIKKNKPLLAVCIYHNAVDLYSIPLLIKSMVKDYRMAVRHHSGTLAETVLYCWCEEKNWYNPT